MLYHQVLHPVDPICDIFTLAPFPPQARCGAPASEIYVCMYNHALLENIVYSLIILSEL